MKPYRNGYASLRCLAKSRYSVPMIVTMEPFRNLRRLLTMTAASLLVAASARAQVGLYANFTGANLDTTQTVYTALTNTVATTSGSTVVYGPTFGVYADLPIPVIKIGADLRGSFLRASGYRHSSGKLGPRLAVNIPVVKLEPYGEFLVGVGSYITTPNTTTSTTHVDYGYVVGVDRKLIALIDWRVLEFEYTNYYNGSVPTKALSTGLVLRLP